MKWVITIVVALLLMGPLRRRLLYPLLLAWRTAVPVAGGFVAGVLLASMFVNLGGPAWMLIFGPLVAALAIGSAGRQWFHDNFPPDRK